MNTSLILMSKLASMMLMVIAGFIIVRVNVMKSSESAALSRLIVYLLQPCLVFQSFQIDITPDKMKGFICALIMGTSAYLVWIASLTLLKKTLRLDGVDQSSLIYSNVGNLALPLISMILGEEYVFYASALQIPFNLLCWTHGSCIISGERQIHVRRILLNPNIIALVSGLIMSALPFHLPDVLDTAMDSLGSIVGPCSMLVIGMVIARSDLHKVFTDKKAYLITFGRLIVMPASLLLLLAVSGIPGRFPQYLPVIQVCFIALCTPIASTVTQLAVLYDKKAYETGVYSVMTMTLCVLTMPFMLTVFQWLFTSR